MMANTACTIEEHEKKDNLFQLLATGDHYKYIIIEYEAVLFKHAVVTAQAKGGYKIYV